MAEAEAAVPVSSFRGDQATARNNTTDRGVAGAAPGAPNSSPLNMFPQVKIFFFKLDLYIYHLMYFTLKNGEFPGNSFRGYWGWSWFS